MTKSALLGSVLRLGDVDVRSEEAIEIMVKMSKCTAVVRPPSMKKFAMRPRPGEDADADVAMDATMDIDEEEDRKDVYAELKSRTEYYVDHGLKDEKMKTEDDGDETDESERQSKSEQREKVDQEQLVRGFKYGSTYVPCPEGEFPRLSTRKGIDICGFFPDRNVR
jgi:ATP-dependent DNA helicase 2 subunit 2